ncbi:MAG: M1 family metallopeptidase, partial [Candidatus Binatia bacterium]
YDLHLEPDLDAGTFRGELSLTVRLERPLRTIELHAADLEIDEVAVRIWGDRYPGKAKLRPDDEVVELSFARELPSGRVTLVIRYHGELGEQLRGFYKASADGRRYAFTQFEAADARRMLPCFDEPCFKARFRLSVTAAADLAVVSNSPVEREDSAGNGRRTVHFELTPPLSTYLLALAVGPLEASQVRMCGATPIRVWHVPGKGDLVDFSLEAAAESLRRLEDYFAIPYPYGKLDLVAVPDFEAGAMENAGAVFFRETLLLLDPATVSLGERKRAAEVIAHELAHMWYGDLVTMAWWDDLWLNEAFATWMAYRVIDDWKPEWRMWHSFEHDRSAALALDALANTHSIYAKVRSVAEATENFDVITYEKGAAVVRMLERYLGAEAFRDGVRIYMRRHREGNAIAQDLWHALEEAAEREVSRVAKEWILKPGFPLLELKRNGKRGVTVTQERFFADPRVPRSNRRETWPVPLVLKWGGKGGEAVERHLVDAPTKRVASEAAAKAAWVFGNADAGGFYRTLHAPADRAALLADLGSALTPVERQALVGDQWALVRAGRASIDGFLDVADALGDERDHDVLDSLSGSLSLIDDQILETGGESQRRFREWIRACFEPAFETLGWSPGKGETDAEKLLRASLLRIVGLLAEGPAVVEEATRRLDAYVADRRSLDPNLADTVVAIAARNGDLPLYERYRSIAAAARTPQEKRRFLLSLASFRGTESLARTFAAVDAGDIPTQDVALILIRLIANPSVRGEAWKRMTVRWPKLRRRIPPLMISRLVESTPSLREPRYAREVAAFFRKHPVPEAARSLRLAIEVFRLNVELRKRTSGAVERWLAHRGATDGESPG